MQLCDPECRDGTVALVAARAKDLLRFSISSVLHATFGNYPNDPSTELFATTRVRWRRAARALDFIAGYAANSELLNLARYTATGWVVARLPVRRSDNTGEERED